tara:strand:+ start:1229 stop:1396 length:168 start_codon:yes stop_codon:yes gene_type:complete
MMMKPEPHLFDSTVRPADKILHIAIKPEKSVDKVITNVERSKKWVINLAAAMLFR